MLGAPSATQITVGPPNSHNGRQAATCSPPSNAHYQRCVRQQKKKEHQMGRNTHSKATGHRVGAHTALRRAPTGLTAMHRETMRCEHYNTHQMRCTPSKPSANKTPPPATRCPQTPQGRGLRPARREVPATGNKAVTSQPRTGQSTSYIDVKSMYGGAGGWDSSGCAKGAPRSANRRGQEQHRHTGCGSHTRRDEGKQNRQGGGAQQGRRGNQDREPKWRGWESVRMGGRACGKLACARGGSRLSPEGGGGGGFGKWTAVTGPMYGPHCQPFLFYYGIHSLIFPDLA